MNIHDHILDLETRATRAAESDARPPGNLPLGNLPARDAALIEVIASTFKSYIAAEIARAVVPLAKELAEISAVRDLPSSRGTDDDLTVGFSGWSAVYATGRV